MKDVIKKNKIWIIFGLILAVGIFLRTYNFSDWLYLGADQIRDFNLAQKTLESGPGSLPLLGPKAGGTYLRLGPVFYYFQYLSGLISGMDSPEKAAYPDLFFSILAIPLFYLFLRKFFSRYWSLALAASYAVCFFAVQYSRFAWNPNSLPFFNLLFFYALLNFFDAQVRYKKIAWTIVLGVAYAIASQLHFVCFFSFPIAFTVIVIFRKTYFKKPVLDAVKYLPFLLFIFMLFYIPVVLSDIQTSGNNALNFLASFGKKQSGAILAKLIVDDVFNFSKYFLIIFSGIIGASPKTYWFFIFFMAAGVLAGWHFVKKTKEERKNIFIVVVFAWFISYAAVYFPLGSKVQPRHFLPILPIPFIFWGFSLLYLKNKISWSYNRLIVIPALLLLPIALNAYSVRTWFKELNDSQKMISNPRKSGLLKSVGGGSWWHLKQVAAYVTKDCEVEKSAFVVVPPQKSWRSVINYSIKNAKEARDFSVQLGTIKYSPDFCYYFVYFTKNDISDWFDWQTRKTGEKIFGDLSVVRFEILPETLDGVEKIQNPFRKKKVEKNNFQEKNKEEIAADEDEAGIDEEEEIEEEGSDENDAWFVPEDINLEKRVFWKDLLK